MTAGIHAHGVPILGLVLAATSEISFSTNSRNNFVFWKNLEVLFPLFGSLFHCIKHNVLSVFAHHDIINNQLCDYKIRNKLYIALDVKMPSYFFDFYPLFISI